MKPYSPLIAASDIGFRSSQTETIFVGGIVTGPVSVPVVELCVSRSVFLDRGIAGVSRPCWKNLADMGEGRVRRGAVEPDALDAGLQAVLAELVVFCPVDDLAHVGILHGKDYIGGQVLRVSILEVDRLRWAKS